MSTTAALNLKLVAAMAEKMARDVEQHKLWPGELDKAVAQMRAWLSEVRE
ncbi:hypothetical protein G3N95_29750 [Paraburkholderia sp. Tr-20389]|nr:hypothetical protein [Paraburkholderia sp. Tr-20389]MBN3757159.1 hypothetical protein [Paraburkholderia sp. Tr-20389]